MSPFTFFVFQRYTENRCQSDGTKPTHSTKSRMSDKREKLESSRANGQNDG